MISKSSLEEYMSFANFLANESAKITTKYFRKNIEIENKNDDSPVTIADKESELKIRELIEKQYNNHGILAEEFEAKNIESDFLWVIDPIDGTRSYIAGHKDFGTLIALLYKKNPIIGVIDCPAHKERWLGVENLISTLNGKKIQTSLKSNVEDCYVLTSGLYFDNKEFKAGFKRVSNKTKYWKFGGDCYMYGMLASGLVDIVIEDTLKPHDYMALIPVINGSGGIVSDRFGKKITLESDGSFVASCSKSVHDQVIKLLNS
tara:strand:+ start:262 stop:1044 length:783 start_codon:yes stop_codon:yes gene_type:complete